MGNCRGKPSQKGQTVNVEIPQILKTSRRKYAVEVIGRNGAVYFGIWDL